MNGYCLRCHKEVILKDAEPFRMENGDAATKGYCPDCETKYLE